MGTPKFRRASGVLMNISSLPSQFGIGCFSADAETFIDMSVDMGFHWWQVLPITTIGWGNSPYSGISTFAGNSLYICPTELQKQGLLTQDEIRRFAYSGAPYRVDYDFARNNVAQYLPLAFSRINDETKAKIAVFREKEAYWLEDYALYMSLAKTRGYEWRKWENDLKFRKTKAINSAKIALKGDIDFYVFEQYEFFREWGELKHKALMRGVQIIGDLPFYVSTDSADVWSNPKLFQLDENLQPTAIAGVPPDAFAKQGQVWGNCLYNFDAMEKDGFKWWRKRISHCLSMYDALRLDHFRAFYNYFSIPSTDINTAENGHWEFAPKDKLINLFREDNPNAMFIAEDLGLIDDECREFIDSLNIPTMRVFQFGFDGTPSVHLPYRYSENNVAYTGTHDNNTTLGWLYDLQEDTRNFVLKFCSFKGAGWGAGGPQCESTKAIIKSVVSSSASLAILPIQDMLGYGGDTRMNTPGVASGNWEYRLPYEQMMSVDRDFFLDINSTYGRLSGGVKKQ
ncbi:MAG: 4-alpha-glucanotransferase [Clostridia bacterium]